MKTNHSCRIYPEYYKHVRIIKQIAALASGIKVSQLTSDTKKRDVATARFIAMKLLSDYTKLSETNIGGVLYSNNQIDKRCTVIHAKHVVEYAIYMQSKNVNSQIYDVWQFADSMVNMIFNKQTN